MLPAARQPESFRAVPGPGPCPLDFRRMAGAVAPNRPFTPVRHA
jgi:hypothetical protein